MRAVEGISNSVAAGNERVRHIDLGSFVPGGLRPIPIVLKTGFVNRLRAHHPGFGQLRGLSGGRAINAFGRQIESAKLSSTLLLSLSTISQGPEIDSTPIGRTGGQHRTDVSQHHSGSGVIRSDGELPGAHW